MKVVLTALSVLLFISCHTIRRIEAKTDSALARAIKVEEELKLVKKDIEEMKTQIARVSADIDMINEKLTRLLGETQVSVKLSTEVAGIKRRLENIEVRLDFLEAEVSALKVAGRRKKVDVKKRIDEAQRKMLEGNEDEAIKILNELVGLGYDTDEVRYLLGDAFFRKGEYDIALKHWSKIVSDRRKRAIVPKTYLKMAQTFLRLGDTSKAKLMLKAIISEYPESPERKTAVHLLEEIEKKEKRRKRGRR